MPVRACPHAQRAVARRFEADLAVALAEPQDAQARAEALLGVRTIREDRLAQVARRRADLVCPRQDARRRPLGVRAVRARHVLGLRREAPLHVRPAVRRHTRSAVQDLHDVGADARLDLLVHEPIRHRVQVPFDGHVVVDVHPRLEPLDVLEASRRQRSQRRSLHLLEELATTLAVPPHHAGVEVHQQLPQTRVERAQRVKDLVADAREQPSLRDLHGDFDLRLVARVRRASRQHRRAVVLARAPRRCAAPRARTGTRASRPTSIGPAPAPPVPLRSTRGRARDSRSSRGRAACSSPPRTSGSTRRAPRRRARRRSPRPSSRRRSAASCPSSRRRPCRRPTCTCRITSPRRPSHSRYRSQNAVYRSPSGCRSRYSWCSSSSVTPGRCRSRCTHTQSGSGRSASAATLRVQPPLQLLVVDPLQRLPRQPRRRRPPQRQAHRPQAHPHRLRDRPVGAAEKPLLTTRSPCCCASTVSPWAWPRLPGLPPWLRALRPRAVSPPAAVFMTPIWRSRCRSERSPSRSARSRCADLGVHDEPIRAFTIARNPQLPAR